jgi:PPOX class probable F420-dependent enzyme
MQIPADVRTIVESDALAHVVTLDADGAPHVSLAWAGIEADEVVIGTLFDQRKLQNLRRDPRISISFEAGARNEQGLDEYVVLHGTARVTEGGAPELLQRLAVTHLGPGVKFPPMDDPPPGFVVRVAVDRITGVGPEGFRRGARSAR